VQSASIGLKTGSSRPEQVKDRDLEQEKDLLTVRLAAGERAAAEEFVDRYYEKIYLFMRRMGHGRQTSEDLTQECFLQAWKHIGQLKYSRAMSSWLYTIAGNISSAYWRRNRKSSSIDGDFEAIDLEQGSGEDAEHKEQLSRLRDSVMKLPVQFRQAIVLHYLQQLTIIESAEVMGVREGTFKSRLNRALKLLKERLPNEYGFGDKIRN
jgi:RNA polymerase sigma-70 factor, ECF subfamily